MKGPINTANIPDRCTCRREKESIKDTLFRQTQR